MSFGGTFVKLWLSLFVLGTAMFIVFVLPDIHYLSNDGWIPELPSKSTNNTVIKTTEIYEKVNIWFKSENVDCHAWLYRPLPKTAENDLPIILMSHGLGAQKDMGLENYGAMFAKYGFSTIIIDYRHFGGSDGTPRHLVNPQGQVTDINSAIRFIQGSFEKRSIVLFGSSLGGGHMLVAASENHENVVAVAVQLPHLSGQASFKNSIKNRGITTGIKAFVAGLLDIALSKLQCGRVGIKIMGNEAKRASAMAVSSPEEYEMYFSKHPEKYLGDWRNVVLANFILGWKSYSPIDCVEKINVPVLYIAAERDSLCPIEIVREAKSKTSLGEMLEFDADHFSVYGEPYLSVVVEKISELVQRSMLSI